MNVLDSIFVVCWADVLALALVGVWCHGRAWWRYRADLRDATLPRASRLVVAAWARDEWYRMVLKSFLATVALGWFVLRLSATLGLGLSNDLLGVFFRTLGLLGVGGAVLLLSAWRVTVARERRARRPDLTSRHP